MRFLRMPAGAIPVVVALALAGCSSESSKPPQANLPTAQSEDAEAGGGSASKDSPAEKKPFQFGDMLEPFTPPTLAELEKQVEWIDRPVVNALQLRRDLDAKQKPLATVAEALKLRNDSEVAHR